MTRGEIGALRSIANDQLRARQLQVEEGVDVLLDRQTPHVRHDGTRQIGELRVRRTRMEALQVHAPPPEMQVLEASLGELAIQAAGC